MKGRILKVKTGYNPNSSSIGLDMIAFFAAGAAAMVLFNATAAIISAVRARKHVELGEVKEMPVSGHLEAQGHIS